MIHWKFPDFYLNIKSYNYTLKSIFCEYALFSILAKLFFGLAKILLSEIQIYQRLALPII